MNDSDIKRMGTWLKGLLAAEAEVTVVFRKSDGTDRTMLCTLREDILPPLTESTTIKNKNSDLVTVWDVEKGAWRSFKISSVKEIRFSLGHEREKENEL